MAILVTCPHCQLSYRMKDEFAGKKIRCKDCREVFTASEELLGADALEVVSDDDDLEFEDESPSRSRNNTARASKRRSTAKPAKKKSRKSSRALQKNVILGLSILIGGGALVTLGYLGFVALFTDSFERILSASAGLAEDQLQVFRRIRDRDSALRAIESFDAINEKYEKLVERLRKLELEGDLGDVTEQMKLAGEHERERFERLNDDFMKEGERISKLNDPEVNRILEEYGQRTNRGRFGLQREMTKKVKAAGQANIITYTPEADAEYFRQKNLAFPTPIAFTNLTSRYHAETSLGKEHVVVISLEGVEDPNQVMRVMSRCQILAAPFGRETGKSFAFSPQYVLVGGRYGFVTGPVRNLREFVDLIDFGTVTAVDVFDRRIEVKLHPGNGK